MVNTLSFMGLSLRDNYRQYLNKCDSVFSKTLWTLKFESHVICMCHKVLYFLLIIFQAFQNIAYS